ncbi:DNA-binding transcriptional activator of the SARP family [Amycolatopsis xylanica]|uniref:DNA-binding transcriptional activator of the SARP family n=1 Tax=Amycolatopsis xylanica TaxID=589385 RepID=A0A1H3NPU5_9PSEU|nr:BTAD domain-containing putative transcriptional regulator [Amycolatopsis xylanica]SDY90931.1 DNA-binding transcriptional activator of the SARP family [Amycolatopsis xylanica]
MTEILWEPCGVLALRLLGPVEAVIDGAPADLGHPRQRCVLAVLLANANTLVTVDALIDKVWGQDPPASVRNTLYAHIARLRRALAGTDEIRIGKRSGGYLAEVDPGAVDILRFRKLVASARGLDDDEASKVLSEALSLWRGTPLADISGPWVAETRPALDAEWSAAVLDRNAAELRLGRHAEVLADVRALLVTRPLDERLAAQLMLAAYRTGSPADALECFHDIRLRLAEELGVDPSLELRELHGKILRNDPTLDAPSAAAAVRAPAELPPDVADFTDRQAEVDRLCELLALGKAPVAINGPGGVGKSALAVHVAHRLAGRFPDGQLYVDLQGATAGLEPLAPAEVLDRWLHTLGGDATRVPLGVGEAATRFRSLVAGRRLLIVLDNAATAAQVKPLLPAGCAVLITSRVVLATLAGVTHLDLDVLSQDGAVALLGRLAGADRIEADPDQAAAVARLCGYLPLAVRIAGARLAARRTWTMSMLAERLADQHRRLDELQVADLAVRASFTVGYQDLRADAARLFRLLGLLDGPDVSVRVAAALAGCSPLDAEAVLDRLCDAQLLASPVPGRYRMHDLIRLYARELDDGERYAALARAFRCHLADARQSSLLLHPTSTRRLPGCPGLVSTVDTKEQAIDWVDTERANLVAAVSQLGAGPDAKLAVQLTAALFRPFDIRGHWQELSFTHDVAMATAQRIGDRAGEAQTKEDLGYVHGHSGRFDEAISLTREAIEIWREIGDETGEASCLDILGHSYAQLERFDEAVECLLRALEISRSSGHRRGEARVLNTLGLVYQRLGKLAEAIECHTESLELDRELGNHYGEGVAFANLGWAHSRGGHYAEAIDYHQRSLDIARAVGDRYVEAEQLWGLGQAQHALGSASATAHWHQSIAILRDIGALTTAEAVALAEEKVPGTPEVIRRFT